MDGVRQQWCFMMNQVGGNWNRPQRGANCPRWIPIPAPQAPLESGLGVLRPLQVVDGLESKQDGLLRVRWLVLRLMKV